MLPPRTESWRPHALQTRAVPSCLAKCRKAASGASNHLTTHTNSSASPLLWFQHLHRRVEVWAQVLLQGGKGDGALCLTKQSGSTSLAHRPSLGHPDEPGRPEVSSERLKAPSAGWHHGTSHVWQEEKAAASKCSARACFCISAAYGGRTQGCFTLLLLTLRFCHLTFFLSPVISPLWALPNSPVVTRRRAGPELRDFHTTKVSLTSLLVPAAPGSVACGWRIWPPPRAQTLPYELSSCLRLTAGCHGAQLPGGTEKGWLPAVLW